jgi:hypothetical protein
MPDEIVPADKKHRRLVIGWAVLVTVCGLVAMVLIHRLLKVPSDPTPAQLEVAAERALRLVTIIAWLCGASFVGMGFWFLRLGYRISHSGRFPPPGAKVIKDTRVRTGAKARGLALVALVTGLLSIGVGSAAAWSLWRMAVAVLER